jgi:hypothetical protein
LMQSPPPRASLRSMCTKSPALLEAARRERHSYEVVRSTAAAHPAARAAHGSGLFLRSRGRRPPRYERIASFVLAASRCNRSRKASTGGRLECLARETAKCALTSTPLSRPNMVLSSPSARCKPATVVLSRVDANTLCGRVGRHLRVIEAHGKPVERSHGGEGRKPVRPLDDTHVALDHGHVSQLLRPLEAVGLDEAGARQRDDVFLKQGFDNLVDPPETRRRGCRCRLGPKRNYCACAPPKG